MKLKSHFTFSKQQRNGIFLLVGIVILFQCLYFFVNFGSDEISINEKLLAKVNDEIDSLRLSQLANEKQTIYPFNPNFITDYKGASLGMSNEEIDRLLNYRKQNKWVNSAKQFQEVTLVSDSLLQVISPYFKFPDWVENSDQKSSSVFSDRSITKTIHQKQDLNKATAKQLQKVYGIGEALSQRIIKYRDNVLGGFIAEVQLEEVYGLTPEVIENLKEEFAVKTPKQIDKVRLNKATIEELVTIQYIDYDLAHNILEQRQLREGFKSIDELTKVKGFPIEKLDIIKLYLSLD
ncbi:helix-hairpin-helix domain-containing protein [Flavobacteriaceae bacterium XHP0103]|uniref:ComEA family DNA-binding protein n=1 Tax=Marixanthotalea marina TaxID=2844359 RepID=UPI002989DFFA|nr:helix-hairpin-helix domain-containing protein [Marixanthotalea marina]MBU3823055.1 helix-hairpin-helix domain-containing protein [Marixanthotalea marina]